MLRRAVCAAAGRVRYKRLPMPSRPCQRCTSAEASGSGLFSETEDGCVDSLLGSYNVRRVLHAASPDPTTRRIGAAASVDELFLELRAHHADLTPEHLSHSVLVLWDLQKIYNEAYLQNLGKEDADSSPEHMLHNYISQLKEHDDFARLLRLLEIHSPDLTVSEATCCLLYMKKMGVSPAEAVMEKLLTRCEEAVVSGEIKDSLVDLTRLTAAIEPKINFRYLHVLSQVLPDALTYVDRCSSPEDLRLLTFLLHNVQLLLTEPALNKYKLRVRHLIETGILKSKHYPVLLKVAALLNLPHWARSNVDDIRDICELIAPDIPSMDPGSIVTLHRIFQTQLEPAQMMESVSKRAAQLISSMMYDERISPFLKLPHLLFCQVTYSAPEKRTAIEKLTAQCMAKIFPSTLVAFYKILRYIKTPNTQLSDIFWGKTIDFLIEKRDDDNLVITLSHKYMYFSNIGNLYRNLYFERLMLNIMLKIFNESYLTMFPKKLSRICTFIIAYGYSSHSIHINEMEKIVKRIELVKDQFDSLDCLLLSRGLQISSVCMAKRTTSPVLAHLLLRIDNAITERTQTLSESQDITLGEVNCLVKCHINKKTNPDADVTYDLIRNYSTAKNIKDQLNSQSIRDVAFNLNTCAAIVPSLFEDIASYVVTHKCRLLGETVQKIMLLYHNLGYSPMRQEVFQETSEIIERDKLIMNSLTLLQACSALAYFQHLPRSLLQYIFSIEFMERVDAEIATCYQKWLYPGRVRQQLMELNRAVCLETPQHRIPWFHQKYLQERLATTPVRTTLFERNVLATLKSLAPKAHVQAPHHSPYGYKVNFLLHLDEDGNLDTADTISAQHQKVAILLLDGSNFCKLLNEDGGTGQYKTVLRGAAKHRRRHLEIMGYKPVEISASLWNSMHMTEPNVKANFLRRQIWDNVRDRTTVDSVSRQ